LRTWLPGQAALHFLTQRLDKQEILPAPEQPARHTVEVVIEPLASVRRPGETRRQ